MMKSLRNELLCVQQPYHDHLNALKENGTSETSRLLFKFSELAHRLVLEWYIGSIHDQWSQRHLGVYLSTLS